MPGELTEITEVATALGMLNHDLATAATLLPPAELENVPLAVWQRLIEAYAQPKYRPSFARAFDNVGFPVMPTVVSAGGHGEAPRGLLAFLRRAAAIEPPVFRHQSPHVITPRDFDLSPYFEIVKFNAVHVDEAHFDYRQIRWENDAPIQRKGVS